MDKQDILERSETTDPREYIGKIHKIIKHYDIDEEDDIPVLTKKVNAFLKANPAINAIDTKDLNAEINIKGYVFCKQNGQQKLIKKYYTPMCRSKTKPLEDKIETMEVMLNTLKEETKSYLKQMEIRLNTIEDCLRTLKEENNKRDGILNQVVEVINSGNTVETNNSNGNYFNPSSGKFNQIPQRKQQDISLNFLRGYN